jgi:hypothetical protein
MNTLSGTFRFVVLGIIVMVVVVSCCIFPTIPNNVLYSVEIGGQQGPPTYVEWKDEHQFEQALQQIRGHAVNGANYCLCVVMPGGTPHPYDSGNKCPPSYTCPPVNIRTVKVTKSKAADNIAAGESAVNDPNAYYRVRSPYPDDIAKVANALKP